MFLLIIFQLLTSLLNSGISGPDDGTNFTSILLVILYRKHAKNKKCPKLCFYRMQALFNLPEVKSVISYTNPCIISNIPQFSNSSYIAKYISLNVIFESCKTPKSCSVFEAVITTESLLHFLFLTN